MGLETAVILVLGAVATPTDDEELLKTPSKLLESLRSMDATVLGVVAIGVGVATDCLRSGTHSNMLPNDAWVLPSYGGRGLAEEVGGRDKETDPSSFLMSVGLSFFTGATVTEKGITQERVSKY